MNKELVFKILDAKKQEYEAIREFLPESLRQFQKTLGEYALEWYLSRKHETTGVEEPSKAQDSKPVKKKITID